MDIEPAEIGKSTASTGEVLVRRSQGMIEEVVNVSPEGGIHPLSDPKLLVQTEIHSPRAGPPQQVPLGDLQIVKHVGSCGWWRKCIWIEELVSNMVIVVAHDQRAKADEVTKVSDRRNRRDSDVTRKGARAVLTIVTGPEGRKRCSRFCKHLESCPPAPNHGISPSGNRRAQFLTSANRQVIESIQNEPVARHPRIRAVITVRIEWIVGNATEAVIASVQTCGFLIHVAIGSIEHEPACVAALNLCLENVRLAMAEVSETLQKVS